MFAELPCNNVNPGQSDWSTMVPLLYWNVYYGDKTDDKDFDDVMTEISDSSFTFHLMFGIEENNRFSALLFYLCYTIYFYLCCYEFIFLYVINYFIFSFFHLNLNTKYY